MNHVKFVLFLLFFLLLPLHNFPLFLDNAYVAQADLNLTI